MSRNENSLFSQLPSVNIKRSRFRRNQSVKFTGNVGVLIPFYVEEILPGDTEQIKTNKVVRLQTPITPFMDQLYLDTYYFFVPNRLVWDHWKEFNGENNSSPWTPSVSYTVPQLSVNEGAPVLAGSALDYMGIPINKTGFTFNALPYRAYCAVWNDWFRDENIQYPLNLYKGDNTQIVRGDNSSPWDGNIAGDPLGKCFYAGKFHDYFTSALPAPQKGPDVSIALLSGQTAEVVADGPLFIKPGYPDSTRDAGQIGISAGASNPGLYYYGPDEDGSTLSSYDSGLAVNMAGVGNMVTINQLRSAFQIQKLYEADARGGSRYTEIIRQHFGVVSPDARLQRPEYLGGNRIPINVHQVVQSSATGSGDTPQGNTAAYSLTVDAHGDFIRSFTEHGFIIGVCVVRYDHSYQQGLERFWNRKTRFDYYWPVFAHLGEQAILNKEIFVSGTDVDDEVFGYQEAFADYRYKPSRIAGQMRSDYAQSLDVWHLADDYSSVPRLSAPWIIENKSNVDRVLQVTSSVADQLLFDLYVENTSTRPMPVHSVPGLIDHF